MEPFVTLTGVAAPLDRANVDTDAIIPKQFLRKIERTGFGKHLFHEWRYTDLEGTQEAADFVLNQDIYRKASILVARDNFGCGSSREHAPWALYDFGFRCIIAPSFADIFYNNCINNGMLLVRLDGSEVEELFQFLKQEPGAHIGVDLPNQVVCANGKRYAFAIDGFNKDCLIKGLDQIGWTGQFIQQIEEYESRMVDGRVK